MLSHSLAKILTKGGLHVPILLYQNIRISITRRLTEKYADVLRFPTDCDYLNDMVDWAASAGPGCGKLPSKWSEREFWARERFPAIKRAFADKGEDRHKIRRLEELGFEYDQRAINT